MCYCWGSELLLRPTVRGSLVGMTTSKPTTRQALSQLSGRLRYAWPTRFALILAEGQQLNYSLLYPRLDK